MPDSGVSTARYRIYGLVVESELTLTSVEACPEESASPTIRAISPIGCTVPRTFEA